VQNWWRTVKISSIIPKNSIQALVHFLLYFKKFFTLALIWDQIRYILYIFSCFHIRSND
jgi:hypothetical protein